MKRTFTIDIPDWLNKITFVNILYTLLLFSRNERDIIKLAVDSKSKKSLIWYRTNLAYPLIIIYFPIILTFVSKDFGKLDFSKSIWELTLTGSFTILGINIMRNSLTYINEKLNTDHLPPNIIENFNEDVETTKSGLRNCINYLTILGAILYFLQVGLFIDPKSAAVGPYILLIVVICFISVILGRHITVVQANFLDGSERVSTQVRQMKYNHSSDLKTLESTVLKEGL
jgi:hypothetical protein